MEEMPPFEASELPPEAQAPPHSRQAEEAVLGAVLIYPDAYYEVAQVLKADDFYIIRNRWIWESFVRLNERQDAIDYLTVSQDLEDLGHLAEIGGQAYLISLVNQTPTSLNAQVYGRIVQDNSTRRRMLTSANDMARLAYDQAQSVDTVLDEAEKSVFNISEQRVSNVLQPISQVLSEVYDRVDMLSQRDGEIFGVPTGYIDIDKLPGDLVWARLACCFR